MASLLLVDDDESTRLICGRFFRRQHDVDVVEAANGEEALERLRGTPFDCVLSDYRMGVVNGIDVLEASLELQPQARRVLMSGFADPALEETARRRARIHAFIEKPISMPDFERALVREVLPHLMAP